MIDKKDITGIILAGGKSSRMGTDKGLLKLNDKCFIEYSMAAMKPLVSQILIVSNNADYDKFNLKRVEDLIKEAGPLAGLYSGLTASDTEYNLVLSSDIPLIKTEILKKLMNECEDNFDVIQIMSNNKSMPLIALYRKGCEKVFNNLLKKNERRLQVAVSQCKVKNIVLNPSLELFVTNINTPEDLEKMVYENKD
ncbi:molybdenum cofactor guanylyltransferase [Gaetbulibacter aquiaggeris]|uniref:Probable molybdenum cofactor guanylyltransferase n=1 Tax=Gaetbulibacter aquiaggeris TaxID=1735373 RepID=A0ABW7MQJ8_9FLAO